MNVRRRVLASLLIWLICSGSSVAQDTVQRGDTDGLLRELHAGAGKQMPAPRRYGSMVAI